MATKPLQFSFPCNVMDAWMGMEPEDSLQETAVLLMKDNEKIRGHLDVCKKDGYIRLTVSGIAHCPVTEESEMWTCLISDVLYHTSHKQSDKENSQDSAPDLLPTSNKELAYSEVNDPVDKEKPSDGLDEVDLNESFGNDSYHQDSNFDADKLEIDERDSVATAAVATAEMCSQEKTLEKEDRHECLKCNKTFAKFSGLSSHVRWSHGVLWKDYIHALVNLKNQRERKDYLDNINRTSKGTQKGYNSEKASQTKVLVKCPLCGDQFSEISTLKHHVNSSHEASCKDVSVLKDLEQLQSDLSCEGNGQAISCPQCLKVRFGLHAMKNHLKVWHSEENLANLMKTVKCVAKKKKVTTNTGKPVQCFYCEEIFNGEWSRSHHMRSKCLKNPSQKKWHHCNKCSSKFNSIQALDDHKLKAHIEGVKQYQCDICGKAYSGKSGLNLHRRRQHEVKGHKPIQYYKCRKCEKKFYSLNNLQSHEVTHTKEKEHQCYACGQTFSRLNSLKIHERQVHNNQYPYSCSKCGHGVERKKMLDKHKCNRVRKSDNKSGSPKTRDTMEIEDLPSVEDCVGKISVVGGDSDLVSSGVGTVPGDPFIKQTIPVQKNSNSEMITDGIDATSVYCNPVDFNEVPESVQTSVPLLVRSSGDGIEDQSQSVVTTLSSDHVVLLDTVPRFASGNVNVSATNMQAQTLSTYIQTEDKLNQAELESFPRLANKGVNNAKDINMASSISLVGENSEMVTSAEDNQLIQPNAQKLEANPINTPGTIALSPLFSDAEFYSNNSPPVLPMELPHPLGSDMNLSLSLGDTSSNVSAVNDSNFHSYSLNTNPSISDKSASLHNVLRRFSRSLVSDPMCANLDENDIVKSLVAIDSPGGDLHQSHYCDTP